MRKTWNRLSQWQRYCLLVSVPTYLIAALTAFMPLPPYLSKLIEMVLEGLGGAFFVIGFLGFLEIYGSPSPAGVSNGTPGIAPPQSQGAPQPDVRKPDSQRVER